MGRLRGASARFPSQAIVVEQCPRDQHYDLDVHEWDEHPTPGNYDGDLHDDFE